MNKLKPCPCGKTPKQLCVTEGITHRWIYVTGDCCGEWMIEGRSNLAKVGTPECSDAAIDAWNNAPRRDTEDDVQQ